MISHTHFKHYSTYAFHVIAITFFSFPILWALSTALKTPQELALFPPTYFPNQISWTNFIEILTAYDNTFFIMLLNTIWITLVTSLLVAVISTLAGYAFTFFIFPGKEFVFILILSTILVPFQGLLIPLFDLMAKLKLINTYACLIIIYSHFGVK
jgi:multiple sugar transport system permease protein